MKLPIMGITYENAAKKPPPIVIAKFSLTFTCIYPCVGIKNVNAAATYRIFEGTKEGLKLFIPAANIWLLHAYLTQ